MKRQTITIQLLSICAIAMTISATRLCAVEPPKDSAAPTEEAASDKEKDKEPPASEPAVTDAAPVDTAPAEPGRTQRQPTVDEILKAFQENERPVAEPIMPTASSSGDGDLSKPSVSGRRLRYSDGYFLTDRVGRLVKDGTWYALAFESGDAKQELGTIKLLPNRLLEMVVREAEGTADTVLFLVSGEMTEFMGDNYLLVRKAIRKRDLGNLKK